MTCTRKIDIAFSPEDILAVLSECASDDVALMINTLAKSWSHDAVKCWAINDLNEDGERLIEDLAFYLQEKKKGTIHV